VDERLLGCWTNELGEPGDTTMEFREDDSMICSIREDGSVHTVLFTFSVANGVITTETELESIAVETTYRITEDGRLELTQQNGKITTFIRSA